MALSSLSNLYQAVVMDHSRHPRNKKTIENPTHTMELLNPTCGDAIQVMMRVEDGAIAEIGFKGEGCAISMASASMMTQVMKERTPEEAIELTHAFNQLVGGVSEEPVALSDDEIETELSDAYYLNGVKQFPARYKCAVLAWRALEIGLTEDEQTDLEDGITFADKGE